MMTRSIKSRHKSRQAFTLVELLVVLAVLAGVLIPSLLGYIRRARMMNNVEMANAYRVAA
jgi:type IV pilus assembly protein PilA